jgi:hypothetical protein
MVSTLNSSALASVLALAVAAAVVGVNDAGPRFNSTSPLMLLVATVAEMEEDGGELRLSSRPSIVLMSVNEDVDGRSSVLPSLVPEVGRATETGSGSILTSDIPSVARFEVNDDTVTG